MCVSALQPRPSTHQVLLPLCIPTKRESERDPCPLGAIRCFFLPWRERKVALEGIIFLDRQDEKECDVLRESSKRTDLASSVASSFDTIKKVYFRQNACFLKKVQ